MSFVLAVVVSACAGPTDGQAGTSDTTTPTTPTPAASPWVDSTPTETTPLVVALCRGSNQTWPENVTPEHIQAMFTETDGSSTIADYWRDISHGKFSIEGTLVLDVQLDVTRDQVGDRDDNDGELCRDGATEQYGIDWDTYAGPVVLKPQTLGRTVEEIDEDDTELTVVTEGHSVAADWPSPPFTLVLTKDDHGSLWNGELNDDGVLVTKIENVLVTAVSIEDDQTATFTIVRGQAGGYKDRASTAKSFPSNTRVRDVVDIHGGSGLMVAPAHTHPTTINHELGHLLGWPHSRKLSTADKGYNNCLDIMSAMGCVYTFLLPSGFGGDELKNGPGMMSLFLDRRGWIDEGDRRTFGDETMAGCNEESYSLKALGLDGPGLHQVRVPVRSAIRDGVTSEYLTIELRSQRFVWDQGIPHDAVALHLLGDDGIAYLVDDDEAGGVAGMVAGDRYEVVGDPDDLLDNRFITIDEIDTAAGTAEVTVSMPEEISDDECLAGGSANEQEPSTTTPDEEPETTIPSTTEPDELVGAACVPGTWELDSQAFVDAIATAAGAPAGGRLEYAGGPYTMTITEDGRYESTRDGWSLAIESPEGTMTMIFDSDESGTVSWDDQGSMTYAEQDTTSVTDLTFVIESGGLTETLPMSALPAQVLSQFPQPELMSGTADYTCVDDTLAIVPDDSGVLATWTRVG